MNSGTMDWDIHDETYHLVCIFKNIDVPFLGLVALYFLHLIIVINPICITILLKCAPIVCLIVFVYHHDEKKLAKGCIYSRLIFMGLIFSCVGDALMELDLFSYGMLAFGIAQCFYTTAFGYKIVKLWVAILLIVSAIFFLALILPKIDDTKIMVGLPIYTILLINMCWRAIARVDDTKDGHMACTKLYCAAGSVLFVASDAIIAIDKFHTEIPYITFFVMGTYYVAQLTIALSIVRHPKLGVTIKKSKKQKKNQHK